MKEFNTDVLIVGSGLVGLVAAHCLSSLNYKVTLVDKKNLISSETSLKDTRTVAVSEGSKIFLENLSLWSFLESYAEPIKNINVYDRSSQNKIIFSNQIKNKKLGYVIENTEFSKILINQLKKFKNTKMQYIEILRTNKKQLTPFRIRGLKDTVEDDLVNSRKISIKTFIALCIVSNLNVMFIHRRKYYEIKCDPDNANNIFVIHQFDNPTLKYSYEENVSPENIEKYRTELYNSHSINSPLKAISSYKVPELRDICKKLNIEDDIIKTKTKPQLYQLIIDTL